MASRAFSSSLRSTLRSSFQSSVRHAGRRTMSSTPHAAPKSDKPWIIGSALFFTPLFVYLVSPAGRGVDKAHGHDDHAHPHGHQEVHAATLKDDEGTEADITDSLATAEATDAPNSADSNAPAVQNEHETEHKDSDSSEREKEATPNDLGDAAKQSTTLEAPKQAAEAEGHTPKQAADAKE